MDRAKKKTREHVRERAVEEGRVNQGARVKECVSERASDKKRREREREREREYARVKISQYKYFLSRIQNRNMV